MSNNGMKLKLKIWRQKNCHSPGKFVEYEMEGVSPDTSFLEMIDELNIKLVKKGEEPVAFESDCREGICGACNMVIDGVPHGPQKGTTTCQLFMRHYREGDTIVVEPFRAGAFPLIKDLMVDRSALDTIQQAGGYNRVRVGNAIDANAILVPKPEADKAFDAAACIGCGACVAVCKNASGMLFVSAKVGQLARLPQGQPERWDRAMKMVEAHDEAGFGNCTNTRACEATCPKGISVENIALLNRDYLVGRLKEREEKKVLGEA